MPTELAVELVRAWADRCERLELRLAPGATVADALRAGVAAGFEPAVQADAAQLAIHGRLATPASALRDGDRVELLRPLLADPKQRRRERAGLRRRERPRLSLSLSFGRL